MCVCVCVCVCVHMCRVLGGGGDVSETPKVDFTHSLPIFCFYD